MKVAIINFSGNVGKTTVAKQLLAPRMKAPEFAVETINAGASDERGDTERLKGKQFGDLQEQLLALDAAIVDIGASNVEEFVKLMGQFHGSHEDFDYFVVPTVKEKKQQADTINTIKTLATLGVPAAKIRVVFNKVDPDDAGDLKSDFGALFGFHALESKFTLNPENVIFSNEVFERLRALKTDLARLTTDETDYRAALRDAKNEDAKQLAIQMISAKRLAGSANKNLDDVYAALFK